MPELADSGRSPTPFEMMSPNDGVHPPPEGHGADVGDQATDTMIAELLEDDIRRAQTMDIVVGIEPLRMIPHEFSRMKILSVG